MSLDRKLREELRMGGSSNFGGFRGMGANGASLEKKSLNKKVTLFFHTINPEKMKHFSHEIKKYFFSERVPLRIELFFTYPQVMV